MKNNNILTNKKIQAIINIDKYKNKNDVYKITFIINFNTNLTNYIKQVKFLANDNLISKIITSENTTPAPSYEIIASLPNNAKITIQAQDNHNKQYVYKTTLNKSK